jgi:hypothetical protein
MAEQKTSMSNGSQMRITEDEIRMIKGMFKDNEPALKLMRKMFLPELDPTAPLGQMIDLWMSVSIKEMTPEEAYVRLEARNTLISHIDQVLLQMSLISKMEEQTPAEVKAKLVANSTK